MNIQKGDTVRANKFIERVDRKACLGVGKTALVLHASDGSRDGIQIVMLKLDDGWQMEVCVIDGIPLERVSP